MNGRLALPGSDLTAIAVGAATTGLAVLFVQRFGTPFGVGLLLGVTALAAVVGVYVAAPHVAVAATIPLFAAIPTLKVFVHPLVGATKDLVVFAAVAASAILFFRRRAARQPLIPDTVALALVAFIFALYVANLGGQVSGETGYQAAWFHGVRLFAEPLSLLLVGLSVRDPRRTLRWGAGSLVATAVVVALIGLVQQAMGVDRLLAAGYGYGAEVREAYGFLRSFGTLTEPFSYAAFLLFGLAGALFWIRDRRLAALAIPVIVLGLAASLVRTAALVAVALLGLALAQRGSARFSFLLVLSAAAAAATLFAIGSQQTSTRLVQVSPNQYLTLNGRTELWEEALGTERSNWLLGRGVGATGTASQRAQVTLTGGAREDPTGSYGLVDSGYLAAAADVGLLGLGLILMLLGRLVVLSWRAANRGERSGWLALGLLTTMLLDALTRESFTGFPTAYVSLLLVGVALATWRLPEPRAAAAASGRR